MSQKKINGYVIFLKEVLGKGSYGSVTTPSFRSIEGNRMARKWNARSRYLRKN